MSTTSEHSQPGTVLKLDQGTIIGRNGVVYHVIRELGRGGMGETFLVRRHGPRNIALCCCLKRMQVKANKEEFLDEAYITSLLHHDCIVPVLDIGRDKAGRYFLCMEHVDGVDLKALLAFYEQQDERIPLDFAAYIVSQILQALEYAHSLCDDKGPLNIVHRDVTPSNVLVSRFGRVKLTDFGIARFRAKESYTSTGCVKGKLRYLAPEQCSPRLDIDARTDLHGLGATWFEMLTGAYPYGDLFNDLSVVEALHRGRVNSIRELAPEVDSGTAELVMRLVDPDKERRPRSAGAALEMLDALGPRFDVQQALGAVVRACIDARDGPRGQYDGQLSKAQDLLMNPLGGVNLDEVDFAPESSTGNAGVLAGHGRLRAPLERTSGKREEHRPSVAPDRGARGTHAIVAAAAVATAATGATWMLAFHGQEAAAKPRITGAPVESAASHHQAAGIRTVTPVTAPEARSSDISAEPAQPPDPAIEGRPDARSDVEVAPGPEESAGMRSRTGSLVVVVRAPKAAIWVNGALQPFQRPLRLRNLPPGRYRVAVSEDKGVPVRVHEDVRVTAGKESRVTLDLPTSF